jgi:hypothetical protein
MFLIVTSLTGHGFIHPAAAQDATWIGGTSGSYSNGANWSSGAIPNTGDTATFQNLSPTTVTLSLLSRLVGDWAFTSGAAAHLFDMVDSQIVFDGLGIVDNGASVSIQSNVR